MTLKFSTFDRYEEGVDKSEAPTDMIVFRLGAERFEEYCDTIQESPAGDYVQRIAEVAALRSLFRSDTTITLLVRVCVFKTSYFLVKPDETLSLLFEFQWDELVDSPYSAMVRGGAR